MPASTPVHPDASHLLNAQTTRIDSAVAVVIGAAFALVCAFEAAGRQWFNVAVETDFVGTFIKEAARVQAGTALELKYHPPLYSILLAAVEAVSSSWLGAGLAISIAAIGLTAAMQYLVMTRLAGRAAGVGSTLGLACSPLLVSYGMQATSDMFFLAAYSTAWLAVLRGIEKRNALAWGLAGLAVALTVLTRTNGIILLPLLGVPLILIRQPWKQRFVHIASAAAGFALPVLLWAIYATSTGSPLSPTDNHLNLALTFYGPPDDRITWDSLEALRGKFDSSLEVLTHDPAHIAGLYTRDALKLPGHLLFDLVRWPLVLLSLPGLVLLAWRGRRTGTWLLLGITLLHIALINLKAWDARFYFFVLPIIGAGLGLTLQWLWQQKRLPSVPVRIAFCVILIGVSYLTYKSARAAVYQFPDYYDPILAEVVKIAKPHVPPGSIVQARKPHVPFYLDAEMAGYPDVETLEDYRAFLQGQARDKPLYVFAGRFEILNERFAGFFTDPSFPPPWLTPVATGRDTDNKLWTLYHFEPTAPSAIPQTNPATAPRD